MRTNSLIRALAVVAMLAAACSKSEEVDPTNPNVSVPDPEGTVTLSMRNANSGKTYLDNTNIYIDKADNFTGGQFVSLGTVKGLGNVSYIPKSGWISQTAVVPGEGYVAYASGRFYRIYVVRNTTNIAHEIIGAEINYQAPFGGADEAIALPEKSITFESEGGEKELMFTNKSIIPCTLEPEGFDGCGATWIYANGNSFLPAGIRISAAPNTSTQEFKGKVVLTATNGKVTELSVTRKGVAPAIGFDWTILEVDYKAQTYDVNIVSNTEVDYAAVTVTSDAPWCRVAEKIDRGISLAIEKNVTGAPRTATVTIKTKNGKLSGSMQVVQGSVDFSLSQTTLDYDRTASKQTVTLLPIDFAATVKSGADWCTGSVISNVIEISVAANTTSQNRTTVVTVTVEGVSKSITVNQSRYSVGDYYQEGKLEGVVYILKTGFHGGIVSLDETQAQWSTEKIYTEATDPDNGLNNMNKIRAITNWFEKYPAFAWCEAKNTNGITGWYLPARNELSTVNEGITAINATLQAKGKTSLSKNEYYYWSSTDDDGNFAYSYSFYYSSVSFGDKNIQYCVRAVAAF